MKTKIISKKSLLYQIVMERFSQEFDIKDICEIYVNSKDKVYTATWIDCNGVTNVDSGYLPGIDTTIKFI